VSRAGKRKSERLGENVVVLTLRGFKPGSKTLSPFTPRVLKNTIFRPSFRSRGTRTHGELEQELRRQLRRKPADKAAIPPAGLSLEHQPAVRDAHAPPAFEPPPAELRCVVKAGPIHRTVPVHVRRNILLPHARMERWLGVLRLGGGQQAKRQQENCQLGTNPHC